MTIEELSKRAAIQKEIDILRRQIGNAEPRYATDMVNGSSSAFPYVQRSFRVAGYDFEMYYAKLKRLQTKLSKKLDELIDEQEKIMDYIQKVEDSTMRQILMCRYIDGMTWEQIGAEIGYSGKSIRRKHTAFFRKEKRC